MPGRAQRGLRGAGVCLAMRNLSATFNGTGSAPARLARLHALEPDLALGSMSRLKPRSLKYEINCGRPWKQKDCQVRTL